MSYGLAFSNLQRGSGGGSSLYSTTGGRGGGLLSLITNWLSLDGVIDASGQDGYGGGGGGSGGGVAISAEIFIGNGSIKSNGGNGGYAGGVMAGGGGGGGRISVNSSAYSFSGSLSASGGFRPMTYDTESITAGAGTIFMSLSNKVSAVTAIIVSSTGVSNYTLNLFKKQGITLQCAIQPTYPAYIFDSLDGVDIHILGNARAALAGSLVTLTSVVASGFPTVSVVSGSLLSFTPSFSVLGFQLDLLNCTIALGSNVTISTGGKFILRSTSSSFNSLSGNYVFDILDITSGGTLFGKDVNLRANAFRMDGSSIQVENTVSLFGSSLDIIDSSVFGSLSTSRLDLESNFTRIYGTLVFNVSLAVNGSMSIDGILTSLSEAALVLSSSSSLSAAANSVMDLNLYSSGKISLDTNSNFTLKGYGICALNCSFAIPSSSTLNFSGVFNFQSTGSIIGSGSLTITGELFPPLLLQDSLRIYVEEAGILYFNSSGETYVSSTHFLVLGRVVVATSVHIHNLNCSGQIAVSAGGLLSINSTFVLQDGCNLLGDGILLISQNATMLSDPVYPMVNFLQANIVNYGEILAEGGEVTFSQGSRLSNYGRIVFKNQIWSSVAGSISFQKFPSVEDVGDFGVKTLLNASLETCATLCLDDLLPVELYSGPPPPIIDYFPCRSFEYLPRLNLCRFHIELPTFTEATFIDPFAADLYIKVPAWAEPSVLTNYASANVTVVSGSLGDLDMLILNYGALFVPPETSMVLSNAYEQNITGMILGEGTVLFNGSNNILHNNFYAPDILMNISGPFLSKYLCKP